MFDFFALGKQQRTSSALFIFEKRVDICGS